LSGAYTFDDQIMTNDRISIADDFSKYPGPRYERDGADSGEKFRKTVLIPALREAKARTAVLTVVLDNVAGYGSSFLEEAFGGLIRSGFTPEELRRHLNIVAETPRFQHHRVRALSYIAEQVERLAVA
jgi:hypothetical protein